MAGRQGTGATAACDAPTISYSLKFSFNWLLPEHEIPKVVLVSVLVVHRGLLISRDVNKGALGMCAGLRPCSLTWPFHGLCNLFHTISAQFFHL